MNKKSMVKIGTVFFLIILSLFLIIFLPTASSIKGTSTDVAYDCFYEEHGIVNNKIICNATLGKNLNLAQQFNFTTSNNITSFTYKQIKYETVSINDYGMNKFTDNCKTDWVNLTTIIINGTQTIQLNQGLWYCPDLNVNRSCFNVNKKICDYYSYEIIGTHIETKRNEYPLIYNKEITPTLNKEKVYKYKSNPPQNLVKNDILTIEIDYKTNIISSGTGFGSSGKWDTIGIDPWWSGIYDRYSISITPPTNWNIPANFTYNITINSTEQGCMTPDGQRIVYHNALGGITDSPIELDVVNITGPGGGDNVTLYFRIQEEIPVGKTNDTAYKLYCNKTSIGTSLTLRNEQNVHAFFDNISYPNSPIVNGTRNYNQTDGSGTQTDVNITGGKLLFTGGVGVAPQIYLEGLNFTNFTFTFDMNRTGGAVGSDGGVSLWYHYIDATSFLYVHDTKYINLGVCPTAKGGVKRFGNITAGGCLTNETYNSSIANGNYNLYTLNLWTNGSYHKFKVYNDSTTDFDQLTYTWKQNEGNTSGKFRLGVGGTTSYTWIDNLKIDLYIDGNPTTVLGSKETINYVPFEYISMIGNDRPSVYNATAAFGSPGWLPLYLGDIQARNQSYGLDYQMGLFAFMYDYNNDSIECNFTIRNPDNTYDKGYDGVGINNVKGNYSYDPSIATWDYWIQANNTQYGKYNYTLNCTDGVGSYYDEGNWSVFENTTSEFTVYFASNRSDGAIGFATNISLGSKIKNGSYDEIAENRFLLYLPSGGLLYNDNHSRNYGEYYWNMSNSTFLNESGTWIGEACYRNIWGLHDCKNVTYEVNDSVDILPTFWTFTPDTGETETANNFTLAHNSVESFNFTFNWTDSVVMNSTQFTNWSDALFNSTITYESFVVGNGERRSNWITLNISADIPRVTNWTDNITISRVSWIPGVNKTWTIPVFVGVDPPAGIPQAWDVGRINPCGDGLASCDIITLRSATATSALTQSWLIKNIGGSGLYDCSARMDWSNGSLRVNPTFTCFQNVDDYGFSLMEDEIGNCKSSDGRFDIPDIGDWMKINANFGSTFGVGNYTGNLEVECVASAHRYYNRTLPSAGSPDNHPKIYLFISAVGGVGGGGGGGGGGDQPRPKSKTSLGGYCNISSECNSDLCDLAIDNVTLKKSIYYQTCIDTGMRNSNGVCEPDIGERYPDTYDCAGAEKVASVFSSLYVKIGAGVFAVLLLFLFTRPQTPTKKKKVKNEKFK